MKSEGMNLSSKKELRKVLMGIRKEVNSEAFEKEIFEKIIMEETFRCAKVIFCYVSYGSEVGTRKLIREILNQGKTLVVPKCTDDSGHMIGVEIKKEEELKDGMYGIAEPLSDKEFEKGKIDLAIVPGIAFDREGFRLGYGKGYYDRFLKDFKGKTIGICHRELFIESLPHGEYDISVDKVIY